MNEKFVEKIYKTIVEDGVGEYKNLLDNTALKNTTDKYWINALELYEKLTSEEKEKMLKFAELIMIDTISSVFGILDGSSTLSGGDFEFEVRINGISTEDELQDTFLGLGIFRGVFLRFHGLRLGARALVLVD